MISPPLPAQEEQRVQAIASYQILDTAPEPEYDQLVELATFICETPIGLISLVDRDRQWFKASCGFDSTETSRQISFCAHAILHPEVLIVENCLEDLRFFDNPLVTGEEGVRFYAGAPVCWIADLVL